MSNISRRAFIKGALAGTASVAALGLTGISALAEENLYTPGIYTAKAQGYMSYVTVTMTFSETEITACTIDAPGELTVYEYTFVASETTTDARVVFEVSADAGTTFDLQAVSLARGSASLLPDWTPISSSEEVSSSSEGSTGLGEKAFALPGFRAGATVYGITGKALLTLPEAEWSSADQVRDAVRGRLPSGLYLVKFDGVSGAVRIPVSR